METRRMGDRSAARGESQSRRRVVQGLAGGGLATVLAARSAGAVAQEGGTPAAEGEVPAVVEAWFEAWNGDDPAAELAALYTEDGIHEDVPTGTRSEPGEVEAFLSPFIEQVSDLQVERISAFGAGDWAAAEQTFAFTYTGQIEGLPPGNGERIENRAVTVFELEGDAIARASDYYDNTGFLAALGLLPGPTDAGTPPA